MTDFRRETVPTSAVNDLSLGGGFGDSQKKSVSWRVKTVTEVLSVYPDRYTCISYLGYTQYSIHTPGFPFSPYILDIYLTHCTDYTL